MEVAEIWEERDIVILEFFILRKNKPESNWTHILDF